MAEPPMLAVGQVVRYPEPPVTGPEYLDGYRNFFNLTAVPGAPRLIMNRGIDHPAWVSAPDGKRRPVILLRSNPLQAGTAKTPWHDVIDLKAGRVRYYGDHRADTQGPPGSTRGNAALLLAAEAHLSNNPDDRRKAVPLLLFRSVERNNQTKGYLEFCGLGTIMSVDTIQQNDPDSGAEFTNYVFEISLLDLSPEQNQLDWRWINARRQADLSTAEADLLAPSCWKDWINTTHTVSPAAGREKPGQKVERRRSTRSPDWTWDELVLACALVYKNDWKEIKRNDTRALELSDLLQLLPIHPPESRGDDFRNPNSIQHKTADIATAHPEYKGKTTKGGRLTKEVVRAFLDRPQEMLAAAERIRDIVAKGDADTIEAVSAQPADEAETSADEGRILERLHRYRERDPKLRERKIRSVVASGQPLACEVCSFDFARTYGKHGQGYIEVHHIVPLHEAGPSKTELQDLALLCANCHRMCHRRLEKTSTWPSPSELRAMINS